MTTYLSKYFVQTIYSLIAIKYISFSLQEFSLQFCMKTRYQSKLYSVSFSNRKFLYIVEILNLKKSWKLLEIDTNVKNFSSNNIYECMQNTNGYY